jgi:hypothetical protein
MTKEPDRGCAVVGGEQRIFIREPVDDGREILARYLVLAPGRQLRTELLLGLPMFLDMLVEEMRVCPFCDAGQERGNRMLDVADQAQRDRMTAPEVRWIDIDLDDVRVLGVKLPPREICASIRRVSLFKSVW